jgi:hypothetical protein
MDLEVKTLFDTLPAGTNLTCFIDCCHSGTITRELALGADIRARRMVLSPEEGAAARHRLLALRAGTRGVTIGGQERMRNIAFTACMDSEVAYESDGQGDFTRQALQILSNGSRGLTNEQFAAAVMGAFAAAPRQHPQLDCPSHVRSQLFLQV